MQRSWIPTLCWNLGKTCSKLQKGHDCNLGKLKPHRWGTRCNNVSRRASSKRKNPDNREWRPRRFNSIKPSYFLLRPKKLVLIHAIQWTAPRSAKILQNSSSTRRHDPEKKDLCKNYQKRSQRSKWSNESVRNLKEDLIWMVDDSVKGCQYKMWRKIHVFNGNDGVVQSARVKMANGEISRAVVKLTPVFYGVFETEKRASTMSSLRLNFWSIPLPRVNSLQAIGFISWQSTGDTWNLL